MNLIKTSTIHLLQKHILVLYVVQNAINADGMLLNRMSILVLTAKTLLKKSMSKLTKHWVQMEGIALKEPLWFLKL